MGVLWGPALPPERGTPMVVTRALVQGLLLCGIAAVAPPSESAAQPSTTTIELSPGDDLTRVLAQSGRGTTVVLAPGEYRLTPYPLTEEIQRMANTLVVGTAIANDRGPTDKNRRLHKMVLTTTNRTQRGE